MQSLKYFYTLVLLVVLPFITTAQNLDESFEGVFPPTGWITFDNGIGTVRSWEQSTINPRTGGAHARIRLEDVNGGFAEDWLVSPKLAPVSGNSTFSFYATNALPANANSVYSVRVSTGDQDDGDNYTTELFFNDFMINSVGTYQEFTVDLSDYEGQEIFVAIVVENDNGNNLLVDDVTGPPIVPPATPPNCDAMLVSPVIGSTTVDADATLTWNAATGSATGYLLQIGTTEGGDDFLTSTNVGNTVTFDPTNDFEFNTTYYVSITPYNNNGNATINCMSSIFTTGDNPVITLECSQDPNAEESRTICYENDRNVELLITSDNNSQVQLEFLAGTVEENIDELFVYDSDLDTGVVLNDGFTFGDAGDFSNFNYTSSNGNLFLQILPDNDNSCGDGSQLPIEITASCAACLPPVGTAAQASCNGNNQEFFIDVEITDIGGDTVNIFNDQNGDISTVTETGTVTIGPFSFGTITVSLENAEDQSCTVNLFPITVDGCRPVNDDCTTPTVLTLSNGPDCTAGMSGTTFFATPSPEDALCDGFGDDDDVWYSFTPATTDTFIIELSGTEEPIYVHVYDGDCMNGLNSVSECFENQRTKVGLDAGVTYLVQLYSATIDEFFNFDICVYVEPDPPVNDLCSNATSIDCDNGENLSNQDATFATDNSKRTCGTNVVGRGVWYTFIGNGGLVTLSSTPDNWDSELQLWVGTDCTTMTCQARQDKATTGGTEILANEPTVTGETYYVYVGRYNDDASGVTGTFNLNISCAQPLLVELISFVGEPTDKTNTLEWIVGDESFMDSYVVERSLDGREDWLKVGAVAAANEADQLYRWEDEEPLQLGYYRLKMVQRDGAFEYSETISIEREAQTGKLTVAPVPATDQLNVGYELRAPQTLYFTLNDLSGRTVLREKVEATAGLNQTPLLIGDLAAGTYLLSVESNELNDTLRVVKQ